MLHISEWEDKVFNTTFYSFNKTALQLFHFQYENNLIYRQFTDSIGIKPAEVQDIHAIPYLPIQFFKSQKVITSHFEPETVFESSGTGNTTRSKHYVKSVDVYKRSFLNTFELFYGNETGWCILGLLPSYLEGKNSSLIAMVNELIKRSGHPLSGFVLNDPGKLQHTLLHNEIIKQPTLLIGVTYALLDFAEEFPMKLTNTVVVETGGMKGRREEMIREEVHQILQTSFGLNSIHSEYGMTELLSQAYSRGKGLFKCAPWMKVLIRDEDDALQVTSAAQIKSTKSGVINIIDLANIYSCSFIATDDVGKLHSNEMFEVLGRCDASDTRGCSQLIANGS